MESLLFKRMGYLVVVLFMHERRGSIQVTKAAAATTCAHSMLVFHAQPAASLMVVPRKCHVCNYFFGLNYYVGQN